MLPFHVTPQITCPVIQFGYLSECASHEPNALAIRMRKPSKPRGGYRLVSFLLSVMSVSGVHIPHALFYCRFYPSLESRYRQFADIALESCNHSSLRSIHWLIKLKYRFLPAKQSVVCCNLEKRWRSQMLDDIFTALLFIFA